MFAFIVQSWLYSITKIKITNEKFKSNSIENIDISEFTIKKEP